MDSLVSKNDTAASRSKDENKENPADAAAQAPRSLYVFGQILNIIIVTILFFGRGGRIYNSGSHCNWNTGFYVAFMIFAIIYLCEPPARGNQFRIAAPYR